MKANPNKDLSALPESNGPLSSLENLAGRANRTHARFVLAYLQMDQPLPACLRAALAEHVEALKGNDFKRLDVLFTHETNTQPLVLSGFRQSVLGFFGVNRRQQR